MAKDDYDVIVFKILTYLYACIKRKIVFDTIVFKKAVLYEELSEEYFNDILRMMAEENLIEGITTKRIWGGNVLLISAMDDLKITSNGIRYLNDNAKMRKVKKLLVIGAGLIPDLIKLAFA